VKIDEPPPLRQLVQVELELPSGKPFSAHFMVVHSGNSTIGLEFFGRSSHAEWDEFVQAQLRQQPSTNPSAVPAPAADGRVTGPRPPTNPRAPALPTAPPTNPKLAPPPLPRAAPLPVAGTSPQTIQPPGTAAAPAARPPPHHPTPPPYNGPERRRAPRIHMQLELRLRTPRSIHTAHTVSVSMMGATVVVSDLQAQPGETLIINLIQPGTSFSFRRDGVLKRVSPVEGPWVHAGIEFTVLDGARELLFAEFMNTAYATLKP
jgi:hypothetical protein